MAPPQKNFLFLSKALPVLSKALPVLLKALPMAFPVLLN